MKIGIHHSKNSFSERWIGYCDENDIDYKLVDCYNNDIVQQLEDCDALMWHFHHNSIRDTIFAKQLLYAIEASGKRVFPNFNTMWHFDDKVGQKYLLESIGAPFVPTSVFYSREEASDWVKVSHYPIVFKLRNGAGSLNVKLIKNKQQALKHIRRAFSRGFPSYDSYGNLKERMRLFRLGKTNFTDIIIGIIRLFMPPAYSRQRANEKGYVYFQKYIPDNVHDIRIIVIGEKAFAIKRMVRKNDFRASGSGETYYDRSNFNDETVSLSFDIADKMKSQCAVFDYVYSNGEPLLTEISYGFTPKVYDHCTGFWDKELNWNEGKINPYGWMIDLMIK